MWAVNYLLLIFTFVFGVLGLYVGSVITNQPFPFKPRTLTLTFLGLVVALALGMLIAAKL